MDAINAVLDHIDPKCLSEKIPDPSFSRYCGFSFAAFPGSDEKRVHSMVVYNSRKPSLEIDSSITSTHLPLSLILGLVYQVVSISKDGDACTLLRRIDGQELTNDKKRPVLVKLKYLAAAGKPFTATPLLLASLFGCSGKILSALGKRNEDAWEKTDKYGRYPLSVIATVCIPSF